VRAEPLPKVPERLPIPKDVPGAETPPIELPADKAKRPAEIRRLYPALPPVPQEPKALPGPEGRPYTLADWQQIAAANSPQLRQAAADLEAARGNLIQAWTYPNPTFAVQFTPSSDGTTPGTDGISIDQVIKTGGKLKLQAAAAAKALENAELALRKARSDLATQVRNAYFALLVNAETVRVSKALARFTDEVYRLQEDLLEHGFGAAYEPAALRAQAYTTRLALKQAISNYMYSWKQLVATIGLPQLPLSDVAGRIDRAIPYYEYDAVLAYALRNHTDVLTARNTVEQARYNLKLAQVMPIPDVDVNIGLFHDFAVPPHGTTPTASVSIPLPIWDKNRGNIMAAEAGLVRASEEPHRVAVTITNNLSSAYANYKNSLEALESYRRFILPDQVRAYRGVHERRRIDPNSAFADLVQTQQTLVANVTTYLGILSTLWTSVTSVADFLQTDDLFQLGKPLEVPPLPDLEPPHWLCPHPCAPVAEVQTIVEDNAGAVGSLSASDNAASLQNDAVAPLAGKSPVAP
jgi:cobalt-zinc-cadmium efflux system outer membrane protein